MLTRYIIPMQKLKCRFLCPFRCRPNSAPCTGYRIYTLTLANRYCNAGPCRLFPRLLHKQTVISGRTPWIKSTQVKNAAFSDSGH